MSTEISLSIDHTKIDATLTNFPVMIKLDDLADVWTEITADADRKKLKVKTSPGDVECYVEIEQFDTGNSKGVLWTKIPSILSSEDTGFVLEVGLVSDNDSYVGDTGDTPAKSVWDSNFKAVYHMAQDPSAGGACIYDSTTNIKHATPAGSMTSGDLVDGGHGEKALDFDGSDDYLTAGYYNLDDFTIEFKIKPSSLTGYRTLLSNNVGGGSPLTLIRFQTGGTDGNWRH